MCVLVDSCSFELICVLVDQYVIQYFLVCQYLHSFSSPHFGSVFLPSLSEKGKREG